MSGENFGGCVFESTGLCGGGSSDPEGGADIDNFDLAGAFDHDVGGLQVAVDEATAMQGGDTFEAFAEDCDGHTGFESAVDFTSGDDAFVDAGPATFGDGVLDDIKAVAAEDMEEVEAINPLHFEHIDALIELEGVDIDKVVDLNAGNERSDLGHAVHFEVIVMRGVKSSGGEEFKGDGNLEGGGTATLGKHHAALATGAEPFEECAFGGPLDTWALEQRGVALLQGGNSFIVGWGKGG